MAAIDQCSCGMLQLHLGAFTLRMAPCAAEESLATLQAALGKRGARAEQEAVPVFAPRVRTARASLSCAALASAFFETIGRAAPARGRPS